MSCNPSNHVKALELALKIAELEARNKLAAREQLLAIQLLLARQPLPRRFNA